MGALPTPRIFRSPHSARTWSTHWGPFYPKCTPISPAGGPAGAWAPPYTGKCPEKPNTDEWDKEAHITLHYYRDILTTTVLWGNPRLRQRESAGKEENVVEQRASRKATRTRAADGPSASKVDISPRWVTCKRCRINTTCRRFTQDTLAVLSAGRRPPRHTHTPALKSLARRHRLAYFLQHRDSSCRR